MTAAIYVLATYLLGAIPFGLLIGLTRGVDIRTQGSRNIGATNAGRVLGRRWGHLCLALDILKGFGPSLGASLWLVPNARTPGDQFLLLAVALAAVLGHVFPVYLKFCGGKGVATTIGVALGLWPYYTFAMIAALGAYAIGRLTTKLVSVGSLLLAATFPIALYVVLLARGETLTSTWPLQLVAVLLALVIILRHHENIRRLLSGRELSTDQRR